MRRFFLMLTVVMWLAFPSNVKADAAPPAQPPGANPQPGEDTTQVRMMSETVVMDIQKDTPMGSLGQAKVTASFTMRNLGDKTESMAVRFPLTADDGYHNYPEIKDMSVQVNHQPVEIRTIQNEDPVYGTDLVPWIAFDVDFHPGEDVALQVSYTLEAWGEVPFVGFNYIFSTGAAWKGTIGSATLIVRFPYEISDLNILPLFSGDKLSDHQFSDSELKWVFTDFEPTTKDNFNIWIVEPSTWKEVLNYRDNVNVNPNDGESWGMLGKLYKQLASSSRLRGFRSSYFSTDEGVQELFNLSKDSYEKAVQLKPDDPLWHAGFADLLGYYAYWANFEGIDTRNEAVGALQQIQTALQLAPNDQKVRQIADILTYDLPNEMVLNGGVYEFPGLTATPEWFTSTPEQTLLPEASLTVLSTFTPEPPNTPTLMQTQAPSPTSQTKKTTPFCGSILLAPLGLIFFLKRKK